MTWLEILRQRYATHRARIEEIQTRAINDGQRELTEDEVRQVTEAGEAAAALVPQIQAEVARLEQVRSVDAAAARVAADQADEDADDDQADDRQVRGEPLGGTRNGGAQTRDRDPGHYVEHGRNAFFSDLYHARQGDADAARRLDEHNRALATGTEGVGLVAPKWLVDRFAPLARQGRVVADAVVRIPLGSDPRPMTIPKQTAGTDSVVAEQASENTHPSETDAYDTDVDTVVPKPTSGIQVFSRQMLDMSDPAIDALIYADLTAVYNRKVEDKVCALLVTSAGTADTTFATEAAFTGTPPAFPQVDAVIDAAFAVWNARKLPATIVAMRIRRWQKYNKLRDTTGRKLFPTSDAGPVNVDGIGSVMAQGDIDGLPALVTEGLGSTAYPESIIVARASDTLLFESDVTRFRFEEVSGPESIKVGIWGYTAVHQRYSASSVRRVVVTAAS